MGSNGLSWGLVAQLRDTNFGIPADVTFHFGDDDDFEMIEDDIVDDDVKAHRMILALASDKFKDMLYTPHDDNNDVKIENISKSVFSAMISFIYGTTADLQALNICELMELRDVSKDYKVAGLAQATQDTIERFSVTEDNLFETVKDILEIEADSDEMIQHCARFIKSNLKDNEIDEFIESLDQNKTMSENISRAIGNLIPPLCDNCLATPCLNNTTIPNTNNMIPGCKVAVKNNNCPGYWGSAPLAQQGRVTRILSSQVVRVGWCDGSESDYNVYLTQNSEDPQLVYHCGSPGSVAEDLRAPTL